MATITLAQSEYHSVPCDDAYVYTLTSGKVEVYACTLEGSANYHKMFLAVIGPGEVFFPLLEAQSPLKISVFAMTDAEILEAETAQTPPDIFAEMASRWFKKLSDLPWLRYLVGINDDVVSRWFSETVFDETGQASFGASFQASLGTVKETFLFNQEILSILISARFSADERRAGERAENRAKQRVKTMFAAIASILSTEYTWFDRIKDSAMNLDDPISFAVRMVARHFGMATETVKLPPDMTSKMDSLTLMRRLVKKANMQTRLVTLPKDWYKSDAGTLLGYYGENREIIAIISEGIGKYRLFNASTPQGLKVNAAVAARIQQDAFVCYPGLSAKKLNFRDLLRFALKHVWKHDWLTIWGLSALSGILAFVLPMVTATVFQDIIPINDRQALGTVTQVMLVSGFTTAVLGLVRSVAFMRVKSYVALVESALWSRLLSLPARFFRQYEMGDLLNRMQGAPIIMGLLDNNLLSAIFDSLFSFCSLVLMFYYSSELSWRVIIPWGVYIVLSAFVYKKLLFLSEKKIEAMNKTSALTLQILSGLSKFKLQGAESSAFHLWTRVFREEWSWKLKMRWRQSFVSILNIVQPTLMTMAVYWFVMEPVRADPSAQPFLTVSKFMGFQAAFAGFNATLVSLIPYAANIFTAKPYIENLKPILEAEPEVTEDKMDAATLSGDVEIKNVFFSYDPGLPMVLKGISLHVRPGESVAFVGSSGCGKSTLIRLLLGFETPTQGAIYFDGQALAGLNVSSVRSQMGVVLQNGQLMSGDIFTNIVGTLPLTENDAWEAARMVGLDRDIENMPMGMHTMISEGAGNISGGQRQRILLARSLANRPKIIILDEATSALDNTTQSIVTESMKAIRATKITVAHRLSTIEDADRIFVMQDGVVAEEGNYETLMKRDGLFAKLAKRQME
ncbi:MAG: NHLP bacteriocin export ABC transporter permease/ATPase subunit [Synergistaceae bacterium]|jgi:ATP-binding cassette subfamily C protein|nr:NHLP bacteriocin export ABC transporter permease/ATPase subunit [Synergistaceae bacterium]